jgi:aryl-alcohol dehydrogenase-like predicted oxidoreductase
VTASVAGLFHRARSPHGVLGFGGSPVGNCAVAIGLAAVIRDGLVDVIMLANRYSLLNQDALEPVLEPGREHGVTAGVFATGLLSTARPHRDATYEYRPADTTVVRRAGRIAAIRADHGVAVPAGAVPARLSGADDRGRPGHPAGPATPR